MLFIVTFFQINAMARLASITPTPPPPPASPTPVTVHAFCTQSDPPLTIALFLLSFDRCDAAGSDLCVYVGVLGSNRKVKFYSCGPTVYDMAHIGNFRAFLTYDVLKRWLLYQG